MAEGLEEINRKILTQFRLLEFAEKETGRLSRLSKCMSRNGSSSRKFNVEYFSQIIT